MGHAAQGKLVGQIVEPVQVFSNETKFPYQSRIFKIFFPGSIVIGTFPYLLERAHLPISEN